MALESPAAATLAFMGHVYCAYARLLATAAAEGTGLGGRLFYAGELDEAGLAHVAAANIAGAATLAASADRAALRQSLRNGIIDFQVNSLDEALRILKNEIRKRQPVAVAVSVATAAIEDEMIGRGVLPDLLPALPGAQAETAAFATFVAQGARHVANPSAQAERHLGIWAVPAEFAQTPAAFDALLLSHIPEQDHDARRWVRLAPRYLGTATRRLRSVPCDEGTAAALAARLGPELVP